MKPETKSALIKALVGGGVATGLFVLVDWAVVRYDTWESIGLGALVFFLAIGALVFWQQRRQSKKGMSA